MTNRLWTFLGCFVAVGWVVSGVTWAQGYESDDPEDPTIRRSLHEDLGAPGQASRLEQIRFPGRVATREPRGIRERQRLYSGMSFGKAHYLGAIAVRPSLQMEARYSDNVFRSKNGRRDDYQLEARPAVLFEVPVGPSLIGVGAHGTMIKSLNQGREWNKRQYGFFLDGGINVLDESSPWKLALTDAYDQSAVPPTREGESWHSYKMNAASAVLGYRFGDVWNLELGYTNLWRRYTQTQGEPDDVTENAGSARLYYRIMPKTSVYVGYTYTKANRRVDKGRDSTNTTYSLGMKWDATSKLTGSAEINYTDKDMRHVKNESLVGYEISLAYKATKRLTMVLTGSRRINESNTLDGDLVSGATSDLTTLALTADYRIARKTSLTGQIGAGWSDYNGRTALFGPAGVIERRKDRMVYGAIGLRRVMNDWMTMTVELRRT